MLLTGLHSMVCTLHLLIKPSPGIVPPTMVWDLPTDHQMRKRLTVGSHGGISSVVAPFSLMTLGCIKLTHKTSQYKGKKEFSFFLMKKRPEFTKYKIAQMATVPEDLPAPDFDTIFGK